LTTFDPHRSSPNLVTPIYVATEQDQPDAKDSIQR
jgi:hypothetical protein